MSDAAIFAIIIGGLFVLRVVAATVVFCWLLPAGDRCPHCDAPSLWVRSPLWNRIAPWLRTSWCPECSWEGMLRHGPLTPVGDLPPRRERRRPTVERRQYRRDDRRGPGPARPGHRPIEPRENDRA